MDGVHTLPGIIYGIGPDGFGLLGVSHRFSPEARRTFLGFAKAVSWRPAKMEARNAVALALVPSTEGIVACRMTEPATDTYGRSLAMQVEGVLCGWDEGVWRSLATLDTWFADTIAEPCEVRVPTIVGANATLQVKWSPEQATPVIFASRKLISAPARWFASSEEDLHR